MLPVPNASIGLEARGPNDLGLLARLEQPALASDGNSFCTAHCVQLCEYSFYVTPYRVFADIKNCSNFLIASAVGNILQNFKLTLREFGMGHRFCKFGSDRRRKENFSFSDSPHSFPDLLGTCPFDEVTFGSSR